MMPRNVSHIGCAAERAGDTTTTRSYRTSFAERERLHLRQEFYFGRRASKLNSTVATQGPLASRTFFPANSRGLADFEFAKRGD